MIKRFLRWIGLCKPKVKQREWVIWVGDGMAPAPANVVGWPVDIHGRKGKVVERSEVGLYILIEWDD